MKKLAQFTLNFVEALKWLLGYRQEMPLTKKWVELENAELEKLAQAKMWEDNHAKKVRPFWFKKLNTTEKNTLKFKEIREEYEFVVPEPYKRNNIKLSDIIKNNPEFFNRKRTMSDTDYIKCDGNGERTHRDFIKYYEPADLHLSHAFIIGATEQVLHDFNFYDHDQDFRDWFFETRYNLIKLM